jgi:hypothetical protein
MAILELIQPNLKDIDKTIDNLQKALGISRVTSSILVNRGFIVPWGVWSLPRRAPVLGQVFINSNLKI